MFVLEGKDIILRDFCRQDIEKRIYWEKAETEWQLWDAPWEYDGMSDEERRLELDRYVNNMEAWAERSLTLTDGDKRTQFQICTKSGEYVGWCSSYLIDGNGNFSDDGINRAIGICIPEISYRGKGYAFQALCLFIDYLIACGEKEIYTQTWSGNYRMVGLANKLGFTECIRKKNFRTVRGQKYDALTFKLDFDKYKTVNRR